jgi:hypothetical protein
MAVTVASFRQNYPEFASVAKYPLSGFTYYANLAGLLLNATRWGNLIDVGTELFIAHNLAIEAQAQAAAASGSPPGISAGPISAKSVDKASVNYDTNAGLEQDAGHWNLTTYGTRFIKLARMAGAGPVQIGANGCVPPLSSAGAWPGPDCTPGFTNFGT